MGTIAENLLKLQQTKTNIKIAIEGKGQDLTNIPFTEYSNKINEIRTKEDLDAELTEQEALLNKLEEDVNGLKELDNSAINLQIYKYQDLSRVISIGGEFATDEAYESAENYLQGLYALIMGG